ncbi:MAG TPA: elongation factor P hydroxylase [Legionellaceae bacterium]|nr:elongation factor P hydroxylase [Legionellaceae bacterium]
MIALFSTSSQKKEQTYGNHHPDDLIKIFNDCFLIKYQTQLAYGEDEPVYVPKSTTQTCHTIFFAHGFFSSALHECAHWLVAGARRRQLLDYGYWYVPDGRNAEQQILFQQVEVKPQALEWILSEATGYRFQLSFDNLNGPIEAYDVFREAVSLQKLYYESQGLPPRAHLFHQALLRYYQRLKMS